MTEQKPDRTKPDKSKKAKGQRALDALRGLATAFFSDGDTETAVQIRKQHDDLEKILDAAKE